MKNDPVELCRMQDLVFTNSYASWDTVTQMSYEECEAYLMGMARMFKETTARAELARKISTMSEAQAQQVLNALNGH